MVKCYDFTNGCLKVTAQIYDSSYKCSQIQHTNDKMIYRKKKKKIKNGAKFYKDDSGFLTMKDLHPKAYSTAMKYL